MNIQFKKEQSEGKPVIALYIDGNFLLSYIDVEMPDEIKHIVRGFVEASVEYGERKRAREIKALIG